MQTQLFFNTDFLKSYQEFEKIIWIDFEFVRSRRDIEMFEHDPYLVWLKTKYGVTDRKDNKVWVELMKFKNDGSTDFKKIFKDPQNLKKFLNKELIESNTMNLEQRLAILEKRIGIKEYNSSDDELIDPELVKRIRNWYIGRMKKFDKGELPRPSEREFKNKFELNDWEIDQLVDEFGFILE